MSTSKSKLDQNSIRVKVHRISIPEDKDYMTCPMCNYYPMLLTGTKTLTCKLKDSKCYCPNCMFEESLD